MEEKYDMFNKVGDRRDIVDFVKEIEKNQCLYDKTLPEYANKVHNRRAWTAIAKKINSTVPECRDKWRKIRISYMRSLKQQQSDKPPMRPYYLSEYLQFLRPFLTINPMSPSQKKLQEDDKTVVQKNVFSDSESSNGLDNDTDENYNITDPYVINQCNKIKEFSSKYLTPDIIKDLESRSGSFDQNFISKSPNKREYQKDSVLFPPKKRQKMQMNYDNDLLMKKTEELERNFILETLNKNGIETDAMWNDIPISVNLKASFNHGEWILRSSGAEDDAIELKQNNSLSNNIHTKKVTPEPSIDIPIDSNISLDKEMANIGVIDVGTMGVIEGLAALRGSQNKEKVKETVNDKIYHKSEKTNTNHHAEVTPRKMFLLSLLPDVECFSESEMRIFRRHMINVCDNILRQRII